MKLTPIEFLCHVAFMPLQEMTSVMGFQVLSVDAELRKAAGIALSLVLCRSLKECQPHSRNLLDCWSFACKDVKISLWAFAYAELDRLKRKILVHTTNVVCFVT